MDVSGLSSVVVHDRPLSWRLRNLEGVSKALFPWNLFWSQRSVILTLVRTQIARRHRRSILGWAWNLIQPGSQAIVLYVATRGAIRLPDIVSPLGGFGTFFAALIIGQGMGEIVGRGPSLVADRATWVKGSLFPLELLAPTAVGVALYRIIPGGLLGIAAVAIGDGIERAAATLLAFALGLLLAIVWGTTIALALAAIGVYLRDAILAAPVITLGMIFLSPLYLDPQASGIAGLAVGLNPFSTSMSLVLDGLGWVTSHLVPFVAGVAASLFALWVSSLTFRRMSKSFADYV